MGCFSRLH